MKYEWELTEEEFGPFFPYIQDKNEIGRAHV